MNWKNIYEETLKNICEADSNDFDVIVEVERPDFTSELVENENASENALFSFKLDENATEEDYKKFVEYIYNYIGEDIYDYINEEKDGNDMNTDKIRELLKKYGAEDKEIENFMNDLKDYKEDIEDLNDAIEDEKKGAEDYQEMQEVNKDDSNDELFEENEDDEENHDDYLFNAKNLEILKATEEGKKLIIDAPKMAKEELAEAVKKLLSK